MRISDWSSDVCSSDLVGAGTDAGDKRAHSRSFRALEPSIGNIKVVNNFAERPQRGVGLETGEEHQGLEGAAVAFVGELSVRHVEPQFVRLRHISFALDELEARLGVDEEANEPGRRDAIDMAMAARNQTAALS